MRLNLRVTEAPAVEPVTIEDAIESLGLASDYPVTRLHNLIRSARALAETYTNRAFITQTIQLQLDAFPPGRVPWWDGVRQGSIRQFESFEAIELPRPPVQDVIEVRYFDSENAGHVVDDAWYSLDPISEPARVVLNAARSWPQPTRAKAAVLVTYRAGYGATPTLVPPLVRDAILAHIRDVIDRPNQGVSSESIDNASVTYGALQVGAAAESGGAGPTGGLRGGAAAILGPLRVLNVGV